MTAAIERVLGDLTSAEVLERLETAGVANARVNSVREYLDHPQLAARDSWREIESPVGPLKAMRPPARLDGVEPAMSAIPTVGQHTDTVLTELGFDRNAVARLREEGVI